MVGANLVTSRNPDDLPAFNQAMIELFFRVQAEAGARGLTLTPSPQSWFAAPTAIAVGAAITHQSPTTRTTNEPGT